jgi:hypothetical protein
MELNKDKNRLLNFIRNSDLENEEYYDYLSYMLYQKIYYYGDHFKVPNERKMSVKEKSINYLVKTYVRLKSIFYKKNNKINILSTAYFNIDSKINFNNIYISRAPWSYRNRAKDIYNYKLYKLYAAIDEQLRFGNFNTLISQDFFSLIKRTEDELKNYILSNNIKALFLPHDIGFFEKLAIKAFKDLNLPSFAFVHGLQFYLDDTQFNKTDYLVVWGQLSKDDFIKNGFPPQKLFVSGHPNYNSVLPESLKFSFENILIVTLTIAGVPSFGEEIPQLDRSNSIYYLLTLQKVLEDFGVKQVRFRPHPSQNGEWFKKFLDNNFFVEDKDDLKTSLEKSTLVIGPTSTVFIEALLSGVNYIVYEPLTNDLKGLNGYTVVSMYNGDNSKVPTASNADELKYILTNKKTVEKSIINDVINPVFDISEIIDLISKN